MDRAELNIIKINEETYDEIAHHFAAVLREENGSKAEIEAVEEFLSLLPDKEKCRIADLGCGVGKHGRYCAEKGYKVTGLDISKKMIELADEKNKDSMYAKIDLLEIADMCDFQTNEKYDGIISFYAFIHLTYEQSKKALMNLKKHLNENAIVAICVYKGKRDGLYPELLPVLPGRERRKLFLFYRDYQMDELKKLIEETGYEEISTHEWPDTDPISASDKNYDSGVLCILAQYRG